ncbi:MAG: IS630 family transposase [Planctomycetes bacterium]|nr:IS630 family transposase [Planctomycetota bacterium]
MRGWSSKVHRGDRSVRTSAKRGRREGQGAILAKAEERKIIRTIRDLTPHQLKLEFFLWSVGAVMTLIERTLGKALSESTMRNYLNAWGFTIQRPSTRYSRRDDLVVQKWLVEEYPKIARLAKREEAEIHWLDETGVNNQAVYQRGYALKGSTPRPTKAVNKEKVSLISTVTNQGTMRFKLFDGSLSVETLLAFMSGLLDETGRKVFIIMDNLRIHKSRPVLEWADRNADRVRLYYLPPYAPEHNPDEHLNNDLKQNVHRRSGLPIDKETLRRNTLGYMRHIQKTPQKVRSYFQAPSTMYAA